MALATTTRKVARQAALALIDQAAFPTVSGTTALGTTTKLTDGILAPSSQGEDLIGYWLYMASQGSTDSTDVVTEGAPWAAGDTGLTVGSDALFAVGDFIKIEDEIVEVTAKPGANVLTVVRASMNTVDVEHADGLTIYFVGPEVGEIAAVTNVDFSGVLSNLTLAPAFAAVTRSGDDYEIHRHFHPGILNSRLSYILGHLRQNVVLPVTLVTDGDMEDDPAANFGNTDATLANDTTYVRHGRQSLKIAASDALGQAETASIYLPGGTQVVVSADIYIPATTGTETAKLILYDVTNGAEIGTPAESAVKGWVHLEFLATLPATCEEVQAHVQVAINADVIYADHVTVWPTSDVEIALPDFLENPWDIKQVVYYPLGTQLSGSADVTAYKLSEKAPLFFAHFSREFEETGVTTARHFISKRSEHPLWLVARRGYDAFAGATDVLKDADTTNCPEDVLTHLTAASLIDDLALKAAEAEKFQLSTELKNRAAELRYVIRDKLEHMRRPLAKIVGTFHA